MRLSSSTSNMVTAKSRKTFGVSLTHAPRKESSKTPIIVDYLVEHLQNRATNKEGLFRYSGDTKQIKTLVHIFNNGLPVNLKLYDDISIAALLKKYFAELPDPLVTTNVNQCIWEIVRNRHSSNEILLLNMKSALETMPEINLAVLKKMMRLLAELKQYSSENKMNTDNIISNTAGSLRCCPKIIKYCIENYEFFFGEEKFTRTRSLSQSSGTPVSSPRSANGRDNYEDSPTFDGREQARSPRSPRSPRTDMQCSSSSTIGSVSPRSRPQHDNRGSNTSSFESFNLSKSSSDSEIAKLRKTLDELKEELLSLQETSKNFKQRCAELRINYERKKEEDVQLRLQKKDLQAELAFHQTYIRDANVKQVIAGLLEMPKEARRRSRRLRHTLGSLRSIDIQKAFEMIQRKELRKTILLNNSRKLMKMIITREW